MIKKKNVNYFLLNSCQQECLFFTLHCKQNLNASGSLIKDSNQQGSKTLKVA